jgi:hypothetical protein
LNLSPLLDALTNGTFKKIEKEAQVVPYQVGDKEFDTLFILVDGIYPRYSRFVRGITQPLSDQEKKYTGWQEACRKDVERSFGVLQGKFQWIDRPIMLHNLYDIAARVRTCLILHNMCVSDRVMGGDVRATYNPAASTSAFSCHVSNPADLEEMQSISTKQRGTEQRTAGVGIRSAPEHVQSMIANKKEWDSLHNTYDHVQLMQALMDLSAAGLLSKD